MKVACIFKTEMTSTFQLPTIILPQLEKNIHGVEVIGMFFFDENARILRKGNDIGERLNTLAAKKWMLIMACDKCALRRDVADRTFDPCGTSSVKQKI